MEAISNLPDADTSGAAPVERRSILLRGYVETPPESEPQEAPWRPPRSEFVLFFDTETKDDASQQLRFGCYELWNRGLPKERGIFYEHEADVLKPAELDVLRTVSTARSYRLITRTDFVDRFFYPIAKAAGTIVGFNLPFDISRLAIGHDTARTVPRKNGTVDRSMQGGFTFKLSKEPRNGNVRVRHLSRRAAFMNISGAERNLFLDLRTLGAALTGQSHSLKSLAKALGTDTPKAEFTDFASDIDEEFVGYAIDDVRVTRECYEKLIIEYDRHGLTRHTPPTRIYSEASLGKAYLQAMNILPWRQVQRDFPNELLGAIMSSYFGGRAEIHRRREVVRTVYADFASMYPSVCTLQGLWQFVIAVGVDHKDATAEIETFLADIDLTALQEPARWKLLPVLVKVAPDADIFPVRARYGNDPVATIGLNYLSAARGLWFTLADCVASKLLTGKAPKIERAIRFTPREAQPDLRAINIRGNAAYRIDPAAASETGDFYRRLIDLRRSVKAAAGRAVERVDKDRLKSEEKALKLLANSTSYGIFIEINVEDTGKKEPRTIDTGEGSFSTSHNKLEEPGTYFHPLLATLITGAARLMLAITERVALDNGLDWAFCDTDSMALTLPPGAEEEDDDTLMAKAEAVCAWFEALNPYEQKGSILEMEDQNFDPENEGRRLPLFCYAVSAKRYALFNLDGSGNPTIRKASAHGLGHLYPPYREEDPDEAERDSSVLLWQEDLWQDIVAAALRGDSQAVPFAARAGLDLPAASRYSATTPQILRWFSPYNEGRPYSERIRPFGFLTWFHARRPEEVFYEQQDQGAVWDARTKAPRPVAPYDRDIAKAAEKAFDRDRKTWEPIEKAWLRTYTDALRLYHIHPETKFLGGDYMGSGPLSRRHVFASTVEHIGKEADRWEEDSHFGADEDSAISYGADTADRKRMIEGIQRALHVEKIRVVPLAKRAGLADRAVSRLISGDPTVSSEVIERLFRAAEELVARKRAEDREIEALLEWARVQPLSLLATDLRYDPSNLRKVLQRKITPKKLLTRMHELHRRIVI